MRNTANATPLRWIAPAVWAGAIFFSSSIPGSSLPSTGLAPLAHFLEYAILARLIVYALGSAKTVVVKVAIATALAVAFGVSDEIHQAFVPGRTPDMVDVLVDLLGATTGSWIVAKKMDGSSSRP